MTDFLTLATGFVIGASVSFIICHARVAACLRIIRKYEALTEQAILTLKLLNMSQPDPEEKEKAPTK